MNMTELSYFRTFLLGQKSSILNKTHEFKSDYLRTMDSSADDAEIASRDLTMNVSLHLIERDRTILLQIEQALSKIASGTYGQCVNCRQMIDQKRLRARPFASLCIDCMEEHEDSRHLMN